MSNTPSDADIEALAQQHLKAFAQFTGAGEVWFEGEVEFARAVLEKWGTAQPVVREPSEAEIVFAAISSGEWAVTSNQPSSYLTDEGNDRNAWSVQRAVAPYCANLGPGKGWGNRVWNGPTALAALEAASREMGIPLPVAQKGDTPSDEELNSVLCHHWPAFPMQAVLVQMWLRDAMRSALAKWGTPQPVVRGPLTPEQVKIIVLEAGYDSIDAPDPERAAFVTGLRHGEQAHGIAQRGGSNAE